ncbi:hypothetical protein [Lysobacter enzymogenes]|uniref:hypothetical protein n=1 Tax=Lysobacter enzymogenes TaxID=69 RepID=UPI0022649FCE|nr:hypothetical protein [Lysobacter enzymogenes]UZW60645.1 hypothetical protein BV903_025920 [Lysobacter enzymogenes]
MEAKEKFVKLMTYRLYEPSDAVSMSRARYGGELLQLLEKQRTIGALACLDHQMNPGLVSADPNACAKAQNPGS